MGIDAKLLGSGSSVPTNGFRSVKNPPWPVGSRYLSGHPFADLTLFSRSDPLPILQGHQVGDFDPTSADLRDVGKKPFRLNPPNMAAEDLSAWKFIKDAPDTNGGRTTNKTSRRCHASPDLKRF